MPDLGPLLDKLRRTRAKFETALREVPEHHWRTPPSDGAWSAAEVVAHVTMVEILMTGAASKITRKPPVAVPVSKRLHVPVALVAWRGRRVETPIPLDTLLLDDRETMLSRLAEQRSHTIAFLEAGRDTNFRKFRIQHPFLGSLHYYDWFRTMAAHEARHTKQVREIIEICKKGMHKKKLKS